MPTRRLREEVGHEPHQTMTHIHPTAIIDPTATIADDVRIGPFCVIGPDVVIGSGCILHDRVSVVRRTRMGRDNLLYPCCVVGGDPQDRKYAGEDTDCVIGDRNEIREHVTIHRGTANGGGVTTIGSDCLLMVSSHIAHDCYLADHVTLANQVMLAGHITIEGGASVAGGAGVHHFVTIGQLAFVGGLTRAIRDVPPFMIVEGHPSEIRAVNVIGMSRAGISQAEIDAVKDAFKRLYRESGPMAERLPEIRSDHEGVAAVQTLCDAIEASSQGPHGRGREAARSDDKWQTPGQVASSSSTT